MVSSHYSHDLNNSVGTGRRKSQNQKLHSLLSSMETVLHFIFGACSYACHSTNTTNMFETDKEDDDTSKTSGDRSHSPFRANFYSAPSVLSTTRSNSHHSSKALRREHTTIAVSKLNEDDVSCISAHTLEKMASRPPNDSASSQHPNYFQQYYHLDNEKENVMNGAIMQNQHRWQESSQSLHDAASMSGSFSIASSNGTSEFTSVWKQPSSSVFSPTSSSSSTILKRKDSFFSNSSQNATIMNDNIQQVRSVTSSRSIKSSSKSHSPHHTRRIYESPGSRKLRRQIMTDGIGTITEMSKDDYSSLDEIEYIMSNEQEV